jgi:hypothetical protein
MTVKDALSPFCNTGIISPNSNHTVCYNPSKWNWSMKYNLDPGAGAYTYTKQNPGPNTHGTEARLAESAQIIFKEDRWG